jgi:hypothetical protein
VKRAEFEQLSAAALPIIKVVETFDFPARRRYVAENPSDGWGEAGEKKAARSMHPDDREMPGITYGMARALREFLFSHVSDECMTQALDALKLAREKAQP